MSRPPPPAASGIELRMTIEFDGTVEVNSTYWPVLFRRTELRPLDSEAKFVCPKVRSASAVRTVPLC